MWDSEFNTIFTLKIKRKDIQNLGFRQDLCYSLYSFTAYLIIKIKAKTVGDRDHFYSLLQRHRLLTMPGKVDRILWKSTEPSRVRLQRPTYLPTINKSPKIKYFHYKSLLQVVAIYNNCGSKRQRYIRGIRTECSCSVFTTSIVGRNHDTKLVTQITAPKKTK